MTKPLDGIRVLDLTTVVVGPSCTLRLADHGAEIIKLESPEGDMLRTLGGPSPSGHGSGKYLHFNRRKRSICLDLKQAPARDAARRVLGQCDVLVSNIRPSALTRLGLDADATRAADPRLVHCSITGFGPGGPYRGRPAYDTVLQGAAGVAGLSLKRDGTPRYAPLLLCDHVVGEITAGAIIAALFQRERTGIGCALEIPMHETMAAFVMQEHLGPATFTPPLGPAGDARVLDPSNHPLATSDGWISVTSNSDAQVRGLLIAIGREDLIDDPRFRSVADRFRHAREWFAFRADALRARPSAYWLDALTRADVPAMPCHTLESLPDDPHLSAVGLLVDEIHPEEGNIRSIRPTILRDGVVDTPGQPAQPSGAETRAILTEAGFTAAEISALISSGAAREAPQQETPR
jgi:crotonobetainyl-CoA:carnitine CoA-transferase CaiB-like acyl-CoA transferase